MTTNDILSPIALAEEHILNKVFDQDQASLGEVVTKLKESDPSSSPFTQGIVLLRARQVIGAINIWRARWAR